MLPRPQSHSQALGPGVTGAGLLVPTVHPVDPVRRAALQQPLTSSAAFYVNPEELSDNKQHTKYPYVTGASVIGLKYKDGVIIAGDTLASYGSTKRYKDTQRVVGVNKLCAVAAGGELSDFQHIQTLLEELTAEDYRMDDEIQLGPAEIYNYLCRVLYNRRNKFDPLWNSLVVGGLEEGAPFLGMIGMIGTSYTDDHVTTGFASQLARPLLRERQRNDMSEGEAIQLVHDCLRACYYRDKMSMNKFQIAKVTAEGVDVSAPFALDMNWNFKLFAQPTKWAIGAW